MKGRAISLLLLSLFAIFAMGADSCDTSTGGSTTKNAAKAISKGEVGKDWPLTVDRGHVNCLDNGSVVFTAPEGTTYGVNGTAQDHGYKNITPIWRKDPTGLAPRMDISPVLDRGLKLCH